MKRKKQLIIAGAVLCLLAAAWGFYLYNKPRSGVNALQADTSITADSLYSHFAGNEQQANQLFGNKVVEVSGVVALVQPGQQGASVILAAKNDMGGGINCSLASGQQADNLLVGQPVKIKGRCTGYLMDVNLVDAVFVNRK
ncbi:hypothetical protein HNQ91_005070 [Filimonas zeae]|uniref:tRNA_anti-like n=1 Tax=Filimonas zeae TaxID=1737353 RepID=A0A917J5P3_9BACT|nr:hypothetical protein [Filimonas zeae]MDR6341993.1 hypothetical protein [Filimonas zeae]GGH79536.1 hypothetical protein GCM10011379_49050 [Filimonas zeae]